LPDKTAPLSRIIGIDPGSRITGYGIIESSGQNLQLIEAGCIRLPERAFPARLKFLYEQICEICHCHKPRYAAVEEVFHARNSRSALLLGQARGVVLLSLMVAGCDIYEYSALQVKSAVTGYGRAEKIQVKRMVEMLVKADFQKARYDLTDALAVAITHAQVSQFRNKVLEAQR
jgi:crossover junction endodeoxyribonuclease RuvC